MTVDTAAVLVFWISIVGVVYPYAGYPLVLMLLRKYAAQPAELTGTGLPSVAIIIPVHNEEARIERKITNTAALDYPEGMLRVLFVSDGSTDRTVEIISSTAGPFTTLIELPARSGKAVALNSALRQVNSDIIVFTDASIALEPESLRAIVRGFADPHVGCISGEDRISAGAGEGLYGRYELFLRRLESDVHSIVGASGCFYAQRRTLCAPFTEGMAPDFLSVLRTVKQGYRALTAPAAVGVMSSVKSPQQEFERKVRTLLRGMTALFAHKELLNPLRHRMFAFELLSHKVMRWLVPFFLLSLLVSPLALLQHPFYLAAFAAQLGFYLYAAAALAELLNAHKSFPGRVALYFSSVNAAILAAWYQYGIGVRQELWTPSQR